MLSEAVTEPASALRTGALSTYGATPQATEVLRFIRAYWGEHGNAPSYAQIADHLRLKSKSGIHRMLVQLVERGHIRWMPGRARCIELAERQSFTLPVDVGGRLCADAQLVGVSPEEHLRNAVIAYLGGAT
ncbi:LexA family protein [Methylobacterium nigriterrae]|uniref:LexA family protein n=1 Tax=Methylobacterium nigriterrae TaxID=3127512 RepID=UPI003013FBB7